MVRPKRDRRSVYTRRPSARDIAHWAASARPLKIIAAGGCWCGEPYGHDWPGRAEGNPHPREDEPMNGSIWKRMTRADLKDCDDYATDSILFACARGGLVRRSKRGHYIVRAPGSDLTLSISPSSNRSQQVTGVRLRRIFGDLPLVDEPKPPTVPAEKIEDTMTDQDTTPDPTLPCRANGCDKMFVTDGARYAHERTHVQCRHRHETPGCEDVFRTNVGEAAHHRIVHLGARPGAAPRRPKEPNPTLVDALNGLLGDTAVQETAHAAPETPVEAPVPTPTTEPVAAVTGAVRPDVVRTDTDVERVIEILRGIRSSRVLVDAATGLKDIVDSLETVEDWVRADRAELLDRVTQAEAERDDAVKRLQALKDILG